MFVLLLTNLGWRIGGMQAEPMCLFWKWFSDTLKRVERYWLHPLFLNQTSFFWSPSYLIFSIMVCILSMLILAFHLLSIVDIKGSNLATIKSQRWPDSQSPAFMFNHMWDDSVCYMGLLVLLQPWSRLCVIRKRGFISGRSPSARHVDLWPNCICRLHCLFDLFSHSDPPSKIELVWNW